MKRLTTIIITLTTLLPLITTSQTEIRRGLVEDKKAQKIIEDIVRTMEKEFPISIEFEIEAKDAARTNKASLTIDKDRYFGSLEGNMIFADKSTITIYQEEINEASINNIEDFDSDFLNISQFLSEANTKFRPKLIREEDNSYIIDLAPRQSSEFSKIRLIANKTTNRIVSLQLNYIGGGSYIYKVKSWKPKQNIDDSQFRFNKEKHKDVIIIDLR